MGDKRSSSNRAVRNLANLGLAMALGLSACVLVAKGQGTPAQLFKEGYSYQSADDTSDRAAEVYRIVIERYPRSVQAEQALFYLGTYYQNKFFILEERYKTRDWSSFNQAEDALNNYVKKYRRGTYLADAYYALALISLRRGYNDNLYRVRSLSFVDSMGSQTADANVDMYRVVWTPDPDDVLKRTCGKSQLAAGERALINRNSTFENFTIALREWCKSNCY